MAATTTQTCSVEGCEKPALFRTRTRPTFCEVHLADVYQRGGLILLGSFTKPKDDLLTRCSKCGFQAHYKFDYVQQTVGRGEKTCRACYWQNWAVEARKPFDTNFTPVPTDEAKQIAEECGYVYLGPLTKPSLPEDPHGVKCPRCGIISAKRLGDIGWGCRCRKSNKTATAGTSKAPGANLLKNYDDEIVTWWDHDKNSAELWNTAKKGSRKTAWWVCPSGHSFEERIDEVVKGWSRCPICRQREEQEHEAKNAEFDEKYFSALVPDVPELLAAWDEPGIDPWFVPVLGDHGPFRFKCPSGHKRVVSPESFLKYQCSTCRGIETKKRNAAKAAANPSATRLTPEIASQWDAFKNPGLSLATISPMSKRSVWWRDPVCGHAFKDMVKNRDKYERYRCPFCETILDSLAYHYPDVAAQWSGENELSPWQIRPNTSKLSPPPLWVCPTDPTHTWRAMPAQRIKGSGCPECKTVGKSAVERLYAKAAKKVWGNASSGQRVYSDNFTNHSSWSVDVLVDLPGGKQLGIEYDGSYWHKDKTETDLVKSFDLLRHGLILCRIREHPLPGLDINDEFYFELVAYAGSNDPERELAEFAEVLAQHLEST